MKGGSLLVGTSRPLRTTLLGAIVLSTTILVGEIVLSATILLADDEPLILGPPPLPAPVPAAPAVQSGPPAVPAQPNGPQLGGPTSPPPASSPPTSPTPAPIPLLPVPQVLPVPQANGKAPSTPLPMNGPTVIDPAPGSALPNPDGTPFNGPLNGPLAPVPDGAGPPPNPGPPRLRMSQEKDEKDSKDPNDHKDHKDVDEGLKPIPASLVFRTRDIIRPDLLRGKNYRLAEYAPLVDFNFRFEIETPWGTIPAQGMAMLDLRLRELCALEYGSRIAEKNPLFTAGFAQAICNTPQGAYIFATDPIGSVRRTAQVLKRWSLTKKSPGGCKANCEARRRLACLIGCDPETHNEPLECLLDDMTINGTGGWMTVEVGLNFGLPGLGFLPFNAEFKKIMEHRSTLEIQADLDAALIELGIPEASRTRFFASLNYTTTERMAFVYYLRKLIGIENLASLVDGAADTRNEAEALAAIRELQLIADLRHTRDLSRVTFIGVPVLTVDDGTQIIVTVADYLVETPRTAQMIAAYRNSFAAVPTKLATFGRVSAGAQKQFAAAGIDVIRIKLGQPEEAAGKKETTRTASALGASAPTSSSTSAPNSPPATRS
jgi:hypothetical protein